MCHYSSIAAIGNEKDLCNAATLFQINQAARATGTQNEQGGSQVQLDEQVAARLAQEEG